MPQSISSIKADLQFVLLLNSSNPSNKSEEFPVTDSSEILEKFPRIDPQDERFLWDHSFKTQFWEILEKFWEILWGKIPQNFLGLGHHVYGFLGEFMKRINFKKILKISPDYFSGNSWEICSTWSQSFRIFREIEYENSFWEIPGNFSGISRQEIPEKFSRNSLEILRTWSPSLRNFRGMK